MSEARTVGKYGLRLPAPGHKWGFKFSDYVDLTALPPIPAGAFGHMDVVTKPWGIYKNDTLGCCVVSGGEHLVRLWCAEGTGADTVVFDDVATVKNYHAWGNYDPGNPDTDQGCDMIHAADLWIRDGLVDANGNIHKIGIALELDCGTNYLNMDQYWYANYLFDGVGLGILVTSDWQQDFAVGATWDAADFNPNDVVGGHFVPAMARESVNLHGQTVFESDVISWAEKQPITVPGLQVCTTTVMCYATQEKLRNGVDLNGLSWSDMRSDIQKIAAM
jgi:hypothetical protein